MHTYWSGHRGFTWRDWRNRGNSQLVKHKQAEAGEYYSADMLKRPFALPAKKEERHRELINSAIQYI